MRYSLKIFISIVTVLGLVSGVYGYWLMKEVRHQYSETTEKSLVDISTLLASYLSVEASGNKINTLNFKKTFATFHEMNLHSNVHGVKSKPGSINAYITDSKGIVIYDSRTPENLGKNFSQWNDVYLTLQGKYGARSTRTDPHDPLTSVYHVAAPIMHENKLIGVVSVIKPEQSLTGLIEKGRQKIIIAAVLVLLAAILIAALFSFWLTRPINALTRYAQRVSEGENSRPPKSASTEFNKLAKAFDEMRITLEGKKSVESFVQHLTHELKSPLSAIQGAAELLRDDLPKDKKESFISNIETESNRARKQLDALLRLASLESRSTLENPEAIKLQEIFKEIQESKLPLIEQKKLKIEIEADPNKIEVTGERLLVQQMVSSLLDNAIEFSPRGGTILIQAIQSKSHTQIYVRDQGPGIPKYAKERVFEKFYSLERPATGKKSTGMGLNFVMEAVALHSGSVSLAATSPNMLGCNILITLPN